MLGWLRRKPERREMTATQSSAQLAQVLGLDSYMAAGTGVVVTIDKALGVPAVWAAVNFISGTIAGLPLHVYRKTRAGRERISNGIAPILHHAVNDEMSSFEWRKYTYERVFTGGRGFTFIERDARGNVMNLWPLEPEKMTVRAVSGRKQYEYKDGPGKPKVYAAQEIIDLPFMLAADGIGHKSPILANKPAIGLAIAATEYGARFLKQGGVPPFAITGNFLSGNSMKRAADDLEDAVRSAADKERQALILPAGLDIKPIGGNPEDNQLVETQRFCIEQIARIYSLPPTFLQDLTHGTFSNTEQQDLHFVKHTLKRWIEQAEQEMNLKLFGRNAREYVEFSLDGLLRGDFATRMSGYATAIQNAMLTPNEARDLENRPAMEGGDKLMIQGATVPIDDPEPEPEPAPMAAEEPQDDEAQDKEPVNGA